MRLNVVIAFSFAWLWAADCIDPAHGQEAVPGKEKVPSADSSIKQSNKIVGQPLEPSTVLSLGARQAIYTRATNVFSHALLFKPKEASGDDLVFGLAPFIMQEDSRAQVPAPAGSLKPEVRSSISGSKSEVFGTLIWSNGVASVDVSRPALYFQMDMVQFKGRPHVRLAYLWWFPTKEPSGQGGLISQGVRMTLDAGGQPAIWEVLAAESGAELVFVSQSLETAAAAEFGKPLPERRYAVERGIKEAPGVMVARVIDDGPVPMGPIIYVRENGRTISTLTCRCMPAQAKELTGTSTYELLPFQNLSISELLERAKAGMSQRLTFWPGEKGADERLESCVRLPRSF